MVNFVEGVIGKCVFICIIMDKFYDFVVIEIMGFFFSKCDVVLRREDEKEISVKVYNESLGCINFVYKIGVKINVIKGRIFSFEYYNKVLF